MNDNIDNFNILARSFLQKNPQILDTLVSTLYFLADEIANKNSTSDYITPHMFRHQVINITMKKIGYSSSDIPMLCSRDKAADALKQIESLQIPLSTNVIIPSRRALPISKTDNEQH